jgi:hypothetical protein
MYNIRVWILFVHVGVSPVFCCLQRRGTPICVRSVSTPKCVTTRTSTQATTAPSDVSPRTEGRLPGPRCTTSRSISGYATNKMTILVSSRTPVSRHLSSLSSFHGNKCRGTSFGPRPPALRSFPFHRSPIIPSLDAIYNTLTCRQ